jgi:hypothetical protein
VFTSGAVGTFVACDRPAMGDVLIAIAPVTQSNGLRALVIEGLPVTLPNHSASGTAYIIAAVDPYPTGLKVELKLAGVAGGDALPLEDVAWTILAATGRDADDEATSTRALPADLDRLAAR